MINYDSIPGVISEKALTEHIKLYESYKDMLERADLGLLTPNLPDVGMLDHELSTSGWSQGYALSGILLHELYFKNISPNPEWPESNRLISSLNSVFGSFDRCLDLLRSMSLVSRGWVVLAVRPSMPNSLRMFSMDSHDLGSVFGYIPILVIDVWEHAYWMDFGSSKKDYVEGVIAHLDWKTICDRFCATA